jgi:hypothetical protein
MPGSDDGGPSTEKETCTDNLFRQHQTDCREQRQVKARLRVGIRKTHRQNRAPVVASLPATRADAK